MDKTLQLLGLARRAGKLAIGRDAVADAIKKQEAELVLLTSDASVRHQRELAAAGYAKKTITLACDMETAGLALGKRSCIFALKDENFAAAVQKKIDEEDSQYGCKI